MTDTQERSEDEREVAEQSDSRWVTARLTNADPRESYLLKFAAALLLIVVIIGVFGYVVQTQATATLEEDTEQQLVLEAQAEASQISEWIASNEVPARLLSEHPSLNDSVSPVSDTSAVSPANGTVETTAHPAQNYIERQLRLTLRERVNAIHVVNTSSERIVMSTDQGRIEDDISHTPWIRQTAFTGFDDVKTSDPYRNTNNETVVAFMSPAKDATNWALVLTVSSEEIGFDRAIEGTFTEVVRATTEGKTEVLFSDSPHGPTILGEYIQGENQTAVPELQAGLGGESGFRTRATKSDRLGEEHVVAYAPVEGNDDWVVIKHAPADNAYRLTRTIQESLLVFIAIALIGVVLIGGTFGRRTARSIRRLSRKANAIENGNYDVEVENQRRDEVGQLYDSIASMRDALQQRIRELEQSRRDAELLNDQLQVLDRLLRHNLKNDMNVIRLHAESSQNGISGEEHAAKIVEKSDELLEKTDKQRQITRALATDSGRVEVDVADTLRYAIQGLSERYPDATFELDLPETATAIAIDTVEVAFRELLENAIVHNDSPDPEVNVTVTTDETHTRIRIGDNGPRLPEVERHVLRGTQEVDPINHASGMGLWLVFWIVRRSDGRLQYEPRDPSGNVITVELVRQAPTLDESADEIQRGD